MYENIFVAFFCRARFEKEIQNRKKITHTELTKSKQIVILRSQGRVDFIFLLKSV